MFLARRRLPLLLGAQQVEAAPQGGAPTVGGGGEEEGLCGVQVYGGLPGC